MSDIKINSNINDENSNEIVKIFEIINGVDFDHVFKCALQKIKNIVSFSHSLRWLIHYENDKITRYDVIMDESIDKTISYDIGAAQDDLTYLYSKITRPDVLTENEVTPVYFNIPEQILQWMKPLDLYHKARMIMFYNKVYFGNIYLYRAKEEPGFSQEEISILQQFNGQFGCRLYNEFSRPNYRK